MSKNTPATQKRYTADQLQGFLNDIAIGKDTPVSMEEIFDLLDEVDDQKFQDLNSAYWTPMEDTTYNFLFEGMSTATLDGKIVPVVKLRDKHGDTFIAAQTILVNSLRDVQVMPAYCRVVVKNKKKSGNQSYFDMQVKVLPGTRVVKVMQADPNEIFNGPATDL